MFFLTVTQKAFNETITNLYGCLLTEAMIRGVPDQKQVDDYQTGISDLRKCLSADLQLEKEVRMAILNIDSVSGSSTG